MNDIRHKLIGLASRSPRRKFLMEKSGFRIELIDSPGDEVFPTDFDFREVPSYLSVQKAMNALPNADHLEIILAADTVVIQEQNILGKPKDRQDCINMLKNLAMMLSAKFLI